MVGLNLNYLRSPKNNILQYNPKPESNVSDTSLVDTGFINSTQSSYLYGFETALQFGKLGFQSEYMINKLDRADHKDLKFHGFYLYASYFLTEDYRPLNKSLAEFEKIKPTSYRGALELAFRFSYIDLDDKDIYGGHERNVTLGMNWYLNKNIRFMSNIIHANANKRGIKTSPMIYALRAQVDFD